MQDSAINISVCSCLSLVPNVCDCFTNKLSLYEIILILSLKNQMTSVFSSPEHKVLRVSYCDRSLSVVRRRPSSVVRRASSVVRRP